MVGHAVTVVLERFGPAVVLGGELEKTATKIINQPLDF
ncbi:hypothetical protein ABID08_005290 [Rhizobium binae]|uniref:Uncharacterized protein n=1 Tax=Rhizobium binae TaxID=1138190 RepID=A0ABV2MP14_9HYPH